MALHSHPKTSRNMAADSRTPTLLDDAPTVVSSPKASRAPSLKGKGVNDLPLTSTISTTIDQAAPENVLETVSTFRKLSLLSIFTLAEFLDAFNNSALFPAIPIIINDLHFVPTETVWIISAYQLTFAAFLLVVCDYPCAPS